MKIFIVDHPVLIIDSIGYRVETDEDCLVHSMSKPALMC